MDVGVAACYQLGTGPGLRLLTPDEIARSLRAACAMPCGM
jgi:hypothetical protein